MKRWKSHMLPLLFISLIIPWSVFGSNWRSFLNFNVAMVWSIYLIRDFVWKRVNSLFVDVFDLLQSFSVHFLLIGKFLNTFIDAVFEIRYSFIWFSWGSSWCILLSLIHSSSWWRWIFYSSCLLRFPILVRLLVAESLIWSHSFSNFNINFNKLLI